jgi:Tfp pilus assembly protein PilX
MAVYYWLLYKHFYRCMPQGIVCFVVVVVVVVTLLTVSGFYEPD